MKKVSFHIILMVTLVAVFTSCEKNDNTDEVRMRITKIAYNSDMENPLFLFEYGSDGLLSVIIEEYLSSRWISEIVYDSDKKPLQSIESLIIMGRWKMKAQLILTGTVMDLKYPELMMIADTFIY